MEARPDCWQAPRGTHETEDGSGKPGRTDLLAAGTAVTGPAVAGTTRAAAPATTVAAESGYIDTEPGGKVYDSHGRDAVGH